MDRTARLDNIVVVIMAGGSGTRFWPLSTPERPKQFLRLFGNRSLLQRGYDGIADIVPNERIFVLTNQRFVAHVAEQLPQLPAENIVGEPIRRDTAAAVCLGALLAQKRFGNPVVITVTADHLIDPAPLLQETLLSAARAAKDSGALYTCGITPIRPATAYGYLKLGSRVDNDEGVEHYQLDSFQEKPGAATAQQYVDAGCYLWNSGMFVWTAEAILAEMAIQLPGHVEAISKAVAEVDEPTWNGALRTAFEGLDAISIDYAIMEKASGVRCVRGSFSWTDVGGWLAMEDHLPDDGQGNRANVAPHTLDAERNIVFCDNPEDSIVLVGVNDLVVVRAGGSLLVAHKDRLEDIKGVVESLEEPPTG